MPAPEAFAAAEQPFATPELMEQRSLGAITEATHPYLVSELAAASRAIRDYCEWHVAPLAEVKYVRRGRHRDAVWLPAMRIASVDAAAINGTEWDSEQLGRIEFDPATGWTNLEAASVELTYRAGFDPVPETIVSLTLQVAARALGSPLGFVREQAGTVSVTHTQIGFNQAGGTILLPAEQTSLTPYRIGRLP